MMNSLRSWWSQPTLSKATSRECCVGGCERSPVLVVAAIRGSEIKMCLEHARGWVESDTCRDVSRNNQPGDMAPLQRWASPGGFAPVFSAQVAAESQ